MNSRRLRAFPLGLGQQSTTSFFECGGLVQHGKINFGSESEVVSSAMYVRSTLRSGGKANVAAWRPIAAVG